MDPSSPGYAVTRGRDGQDALGVTFVSAFALRVYGVTCWSGSCVLLFCDSVGDVRATFVGTLGSGCNNSLFLLQMSYWCKPFVLR